MTPTRGLLHLLLAATFLAAALDTTEAETIIRKSTSYFSIGGRTAEDLDRELERRGPYTKSSGSRHPGATEIKFGGELTYVEKNGRCEIGSAKVVLTTHLILPRWKNRSKADKQLGMIWDALSSDIKRHEERHAEIARQHARKLEARLKVMRREHNCEILQHKVAKVTDAAIEAHDMDQMRFDRVESINFENRMIRILENRFSRTSR